MKNKDQVIITGIIEGNDKILTCFYKENIRYIQGYVLRNCGNLEDVEDVFQDALVVLYQKLRSGFIELRVPIRTYFYGICKNIWRNRLRKKEKLIIGDEQSRYQKDTNDYLSMDIENQEREHLYKKHFQRLSTDKKKLLSLFFEGRSVKEISEIIGSSEGYTRKKKFQAKKQLLKMIEEDPMYNELKAVC
ncbi:sigma-70 family RNA polymerase sigma factor [Aquimarina sp. 2201CG5-10]|uniref:RNA polymerase sigma factor n=1 Tax=Aquimarina callyspongiae TaxID=3098150 RepID=UPI002AB51CB7|nr:sigma-70 family RNA polymerase sigma factor [Aquimarina sp. 2201CG5-10]MDY8134658.1 sigma-70 family RNA polymerase sigma factor [Aquimarina sp. 2201CG5-10]